MPEKKKNKIQKLNKPLKNKKPYFEKAIHRSAMGMEKCQEGGKVPLIVQSYGMALKGGFCYCSCNGKPDDMHLSSWPVRGFFLDGSNDHDVE